MHRLPFLLLLSLMLLVAACDGGQTVMEEPGDVDVEVDEPETDEETAEQPADAQATFASPADGDTVETPVSVEMEATGVEIVPADAVAPGEGHFHIIVDAGCVEDGEAIPGPGDDAKADGYHHFGDGSTEAELDLEPGEHELCLQLADGEHHAFGETDVITVTVEES